MNQEQFANLLGVSVSCIWHREHNKAALSKEVEMALRWATQEAGLELPEPISKPRTMRVI